MSTISRFAVLATIAAAAGAAGATADSSPKAPASEQAHPKVHPRDGGRSGRFRLTLTAADALGVSGVVETSYRVVTSTQLQSRCDSAFAKSLTRAAKGQRLTVTIAPLHGLSWCPGRYAGTVLLERGPYCPRPVPGHSPRTCPEFATQALDVGRFAFTVR